MEPSQLTIEPKIFNDGDQFAQKSLLKDFIRSIYKACPAKDIRLSKDIPVEYLANNRLNISIKLVFVRFPQSDEESPPGGIELKQYGEFDRLSKSYVFVFTGDSHGNDTRDGIGCFLENTKNNSLMTFPSTTLKDKKNILWETLEVLAQEIGTDVLTIISYIKKWEIPALVIGDKIVFMILADETIYSELLNVKYLPFYRKTDWEGSYLYINNCSKMFHGDIVANKPRKNIVIADEQNQKNKCPLCGDVYTDKPHTPIFHTVMYVFQKYRDH